MSLRGRGDPLRHRLDYERLPFPTLRVQVLRIVYLADLLRSHLKAIGSPFRSLPPGRIAVFLLAMLRHDQRLLDLVGGSGVPESTLRRWHDPSWLTFAGSRDAHRADL